VKIANRILYFILAVMIISSVGIWIPLAIDYFPDSKISEDTLNVLPSNILTYYLSILFIGLIDRILYLIRNREYKHIITEILILGLITAFVIFITYLSFKNIASKDFYYATIYAFIGAATSYIIWWLANFNDKKVDPINALGGEINE